MSQLYNSVMNKSVWSWRTKPSKHTNKNLLKRIWKCRNKLASGSPETNSWKVWSVNTIKSRRTEWGSRRRGRRSRVGGNWRGGGRTSNKSKGLRGSLRSIGIGGGRRRRGRRGSLRTGGRGTKRPLRGRGGKYKIGRRNFNWSNNKDKRSKMLEKKKKDL